MPKKKYYQDDERAGEPPRPNPYAAEQDYFPTALIGKALGMRSWKDKYPKPDPAGKGDLPAGVSVADIRAKYKKPDKSK